MDTYIQFGDIPSKPVGHGLGMVLLRRQAQQHVPQVFRLDQGVLCPQGICAHQDTPRIVNQHFDGTVNHTKTDETSIPLHKTVYPLGIGQQMSVYFSCSLFMKCAKTRSISNSPLLI